MINFKKLQNLDITKQRKQTNYNFVELTKYELGKIYKNFNRVHWDIIFKYHIYKTIM